MGGGLKGTRSDVDTTRRTANLPSIFAIRASMAATTRELCETEPAATPAEAPGLALWNWCHITELITSHRVAAAARDPSTRRIDTMAQKRPASARASPHNSLAVWR